MNRALVATLAAALAVPAFASPPPRPGPAKAGPAPPAKAAPAPPEELGPPDPRRGERLDGRTAPRDPLRRPRAVVRAILAVPRWLIEALTWPIVRVVAYADEHSIPSRIYWAVTSEDGKVGLRPEARYETGFLTSLGVRFFDRRSLGPGSLIELKLRSAGPRFIFGEVRLRLPHESPLTVEWRSQFERNSHLLFGGVQGETREELRAEGREVASYEIDRALASGLVTWPALGWLKLSLRGELDFRTYRTTDTLDRYWCAVPGSPSCAAVGVSDVQVPGFSEGERLVRSGLGIVVDTRHGVRKLGGFRVALDGTVARGILGDPSKHLRASADVRLVLDLSDRALIVRGNMGLARPLGGAPVPFEELMSPTGSDGLRGMRYGRLRGESQAFVSAEYRWLLTPYLDAALFVDRGGAFGRDFEGLSFRDMINNFGFGLRIHRVRGDYWNAPPIVWLQAAAAPDEGLRLILRLGGGE